MTGLRRALLRAVPLALLAACGSDPTVGPPDPPPAGAIVFLVGDAGSMDGSEKAVLDLLRTLDHEVRVLSDDGFEAGDEGDCALVVVSKSVTSHVVADKLRPTACGVFTWEDDQQRLDMLALISDDGSNGASWHTQGRQVWIHGDAPRDLRAALSGPSDLYTRPAQISYAPAGTLTADAVLIAELGERGGLPVVYVVERGARLADGGRASGRRAFFGLHQDTFRLLTPSGRALFEATLRWSLGG